MGAKVIYSEAWNNVIVKDHLLPISLPHLKAGTKIVRIEVKKVGKLKLDGKDLEFQDIRVICELIGD